MTRTERAPEGLRSILQREKGEGSAAQGYRVADLHAEPGLQSADSAATDGNGVTIRSRELDDPIVAGPAQPGDEVEVDDVAAMDADETAAIQARLDVADGERTEQLGA